MTGAVSASAFPFPLLMDKGDDVGQKGQFFQPGPFLPKHPHPLWHLLWAQSRWHHHAQTLLRGAGHNEA